MKKYKHEFWTGCGRTTIDLQISSSEAKLNYSSNWMGQGQFDFEVIFNHKKLDSHFGLLQLVDTTGDLTAPKEVSEFIKDGDYITFEYLELSSPQANFQIDPALEPMKITGHANWDEKFDLILYISVFFEEFAYDDDEKINLFVRELKRLNKVKLKEMF